MQYAVVLSQTNLVPLPNDLIQIQWLKYIDNLKDIP